MPMQMFKNGIKRIVVSNPPNSHLDAPFTVLGRAPWEGAGESWSVRGWEPAMGSWFARQGGMLRDVIDLDLEEAFVELLSTARSGAPPIRAQSQSRSGVAV
jgi:hypothetical protein